MAKEIKYFKYFFTFVSNSSYRCCCSYVMYCSMYSMKIARTENYILTIPSVPELKLKTILLQRLLLQHSTQDKFNLQSEIHNLQCFEEVELPSIFGITAVFIISCAGMIFMYPGKKLNER